MNQARRRRRLREQALLDALVERHLGATEAIDRLLRIADEEQLAGRDLDAVGIALLRVVRREEQEHLRLERVGVLELVDEEVREALLEPDAHALVGAEQIAREHEEIEEVELARARLQLLVAADDALALRIGRAALVQTPQLAKEQRGEIGVGGVEDAIELLLRRGALVAHALHRDARRPC